MKKLLLTSFITAATCFSAVGVANAIDYSDSSTNATQSEARQGGMKNHRGGSFAKLNLTEAQQTKIKEIRDSYRGQGKEGREQARTAIEQILTAEQRAQLEQIKAERQARGDKRGGHHGHKDGRRGGAFAKLNLTEAQQTKIKEIRDSYRAQGMTKDSPLHEQAHAAIEQVLTAEQRAQLEQMKAEREANGGRQGR